MPAKKSPARVGGAEKAGSLAFRLGGDYRHDLERHRIDDHDLILVIEEPVATIGRYDFHDIRRQAEHVEVPRDPHAGPKIEVHPADTESIEPTPVAREHLVDPRPLIGAQLATGGMLAREASAAVGSAGAEALIALATTQTLGALASVGP